MKAVPLHSAVKVLYVSKVEFRKLTIYGIELWNGERYVWRHVSMLTLGIFVSTKCFPQACQTVDDDDDDLDDRKECVKVLHAMVREANRLKLSFPEVSELLETHRSVEAWIDRANIAIRSRISLTEIKALIKRGQAMPVDLSDFMEKLRARESLAEEWINRFEEVVPRPAQTSSGTETNESEEGLLRWMRGMRAALTNGNYSVLHDLASEGNRIPVEVDIVKLLQLELDAKSWTTKAKKWIPCLSDEENTTCKRGKLEDLREHMEKAAQIREKLDLSASAKGAWALDGEVEIRAIVQAADEWLLRVRRGGQFGYLMYLQVLIVRLFHSTNHTWTGTIAVLKGVLASLWKSYGPLWTKGTQFRLTSGVGSGK